MKEKPFDKTIQKIKALQEFLNRDAKRIVGVEAVKFFKDSFDKEGFTDATLEKWEEVERRKADSDWFGFDASGTAAKPDVKHSEKTRITHYSPAATQRKILSGASKELQSSIDYKTTRTGVFVFAQKVYAQIHNEGGPNKVFGKTGKGMPKRQFMGKSATLNKKIREIILNEVKKRFK